MRRGLDTGAHMAYIRSMVASPVMHPLNRAHKFDRLKHEQPYNFYLSCKFDGIRFSIQDNNVYSRTGKIIPNTYIRESILAMDLPNGIDGELICGSFQETTSAVMSMEGTPEFHVFVFDIIQNNIGFNDRYFALYKFFAEKYDLYEPGEPPKILGIVGDKDMICNDYAFGTKFDNLWLVAHTLVTTYKEILDNLKKYKTSEGIILRQYNGKYYDKIWKIKHKLDSEAKIIEVRQLQRKTGELAEQMGSLVVEDICSGKQFNIGTGFNKFDRINIWKNKDSILGAFVKYEYDSVSSYGIPRFPRFIGIRSINDVLCN